jgi:primosomal protein N' (replication factor Y)
VQKRIEEFTADRRDLVLLGPTPLSVVKVNNRFRYRIHINAHADAPLRRAISQAVIDCSQDKRFRGVSVFADSDPLD